MFIKLYTPIATIIAILIAVFSVSSDTIFQSDPNVNTAMMTPIANGKVFVMTDSGVLDLINNTVNISVDSGDDVDIEVAIGQSSDIVAYLGNDSYTRITGMSSWTQLSNVGMETTQNGAKSAPTTGDIHSDMWEYYNSGKAHVNFEWTKKYGATWSLLVFAKSNASSPDAANKKESLSVKLNWKRKASRQFMIPGLSISLLIMVGCLVMHLVYKSKNVRGRHSGEAKRLAELISDKTGEFALPMSTKIRSVREFAKVESNAANQSLLPSLNTNASTQNYQINYGAQNNNWRYYGDDAPSSSIYESQIAHTQSFEPYPSGLNKQIFGTPEIPQPTLGALTSTPPLTAPISTPISTASISTTQMNNFGGNFGAQTEYATAGTFRPPAPPGLELSSTFNTVSKLESAPSESDIKLLSRRELREKGFLKSKKGRGGK